MQYYIIKTTQLKFEDTSFVCSSLILRLALNLYPNLNSYIYVKLRSFIFLRRSANFKKNPETSFKRIN